jgi:hypothetical protein
MSRPLLFIDEDASDYRVIEGLLSHGIDVLTVVQAGRRRRSDEEQLEFAAAKRRILYSLNAGDFGRLHGEWLAQGRSHAGIIVIPRQRYSIGEKVRLISALLDAITPDEFVDRLEYL